MIDAIEKEQEIADKLEREWTNIMTLLAQDN